MSDEQETMRAPGEMTIAIAPLYDVVRARGGARALKITATLTSAEECDLFADLYNAARAQLWPIEDEAAQDDAPAQDEALAPAGAARKEPDAPRGRGGGQWRSVRPESSAGKVLALLQAGWTDPAAMDDELDLKTGVAARLVGSLRKAGLWSPPDPAP